ncbi:FimV/HubP family polar landmark protein [Undibacterium sp. TS12]|uniref:FimV/HubP family polar landmark protein n=1 Tax=Undibacterium sp. TS12 TaxID=2908202 RepID=UPI001F4D2F32|nr:FimV/HubP family polar landmark protein [Undibacterium sp. TS12]MCH8619057.1 LysM peptidoglycan-binding domain-containing protein [Undibacterium sp. TS12]
MHNQKKSSVISLGRKALGAAVASSLLIMSGAHATGLGKLTVLSALGQPLRAEVELTSPAKEEIDSLVPKLASQEAFKQANIDFNAALLSLRFAIEQRGSNYVIRITSAQPMNEPFVDMLLEMNSSNGKLLREYTFLLDPAELRNSQSPQVSNPNAVANQPQNNATSQSGRSSNVPASQGAANNKTATKSPDVSKDIKSAGEYQIRAGDTLSKIAGSHRAEGVSLDQMLVSLYRANPQAFVGNNMNRLRSGQILTIPDADSVRSTTGSANEAHAVVVAHAADFNAYRNKLATQVADAPAEKAPSGKHGSSKITTKVNELPNATTDSPDKLKLSRANPAGTNGKGASAEDKLAKEKAAQESNARVKELEKNVSELQKLLELQKLEIKNKEMAAKQAELTKPRADAKASASAAASVPVVTPPPAPVAASAASKPVSAMASAPAPASTAAASVPASAPAAVQANAPTSVPAVAASAASVTTPKPAKRKIVAPPPPPPPEPSFFDSISDYLLPGGVAILAILGGVGIWTSQRKKKLQQFEDSILTGSSMKANSMFGSTGGQSVDTNNSVFNSNFAPSASQLDANEVDPVAEADVYIAYGRDSQAEEILKEALRTQPDRHAVRVKLLEIYFARKDAKTFERLASELYGMTSGEGDDWAQAASMGIVLEPGNPLYAGGKAKAEAAAGSAMGSGTQPLEDLDPEALLANSLSQDMLEAISIIDTAQRDGGAAKAQEPALDEGALDFDLDISGGAEPEVPTIPESVAKAAPAEEVAAIPEVDFGTIDFDFGAKEAEAAPAPVAEPPATEAEADKFELDLGGMDFSTDVPAAEPLSLDMPPIDDKLDENLIAASLADKPVADTTSEAAASEAQAEAVSAFEFDLSGIDLDLESPSSPSAAPHVEVAEPEAPAHNAEMATKLDLAVAYHEIGDKEGARELLDEVLKGGTAEQIERAKSMMLQMA